MTVPGKDSCAAVRLIMFRHKTKRGSYDHKLSQGCVPLFVAKTWYMTKNVKEYTRSVDLF